MYKVLGGGVTIDGFELRLRLFEAWQIFKRGKMRRRAVQEFWLALEDNLEQLYHELISGTYRHGAYHHFVVHDNKRRDIFVAAVRDRVVHQLVASYLDDLYSERFYTYSCAAQTDKGVALARNCVFEIIRREQGRGRLWTAHLDVEKCYASVPHNNLIKILERRAQNSWWLHLCTEILGSFGSAGRGLPLGNVTSQWLANIYLHEVDWLIKNKLNWHWYMRYNDDLFLLSHNEVELRRVAGIVCDFVKTHLLLDIPNKKQIVRCLPQPVDVLGLCTNGVQKWFRPITKRRAIERLQNCSAYDENFYARLAAYKCLNVCPRFDLWDVL